MQRKGGRGREEGGEKSQREEKKKDMRDDLLSSVNKVPDNAVILCGAGESRGGGSDGGAAETRRLRADDKRPSAVAGKRLSAGRNFIFGSFSFLEAQAKRDASGFHNFPQVGISMSETLPP